MSRSLAITLDPSANGSETVSRRGASSLRSRRLIVGVCAALIRANLRYWPLITPRVRFQLRRWQQMAGAIPDPQLRRLALTKLREEHLNVEAAATLATLAPRSTRAEVVDAIVALQVLYDYLDILGEQPLSNPLRDGERLFQALLDGVSPPAEPRSYYPVGQPDTDGGYLQSLVSTVSGSLARLPTRGAITQAALASAKLCAQAQTRNHAAVSSGAGQLERWAASQAAGTGLGWQEFLAGAAGSILTVHALIAAAGRPQTTTAHAGEIATLYLHISALTMLDSLVDRTLDTQAGQRGYLDYYNGDQQLLERRLGQVVRSVVSQAQRTVDGTHHLMTMIGVIAYYGSAPAATGQGAGSVAKRMCGELGPLIAPTLALMQSWRMTKQVNHLGDTGAKAPA